VQAYFPKGTKMSYPEGGFLLWVEFPKTIDTVLLNENLKQEKISFAPGILFTAAEKYQHCVRLSYSHEATPAIEKAIKTIGEMAKAC